MELFTMQELISNSPSDGSKEKVMPVIARNDPLQKAQEVRQSPGFEELPPKELEGGIQLRARVTDAFCFVDHPVVELDLSGDKVVSFSCDCPEWRTERRFCVHCVALVIGQQKMKAVKSSAQQEETPKKEKPVVQVQEAHENQDAKGPELMDLSYKFCNSQYDLYPVETPPYIPKERFEQVFGKNARADQAYEWFEEDGWGGNCFGFVATSSLLYQPDSGIAVPDFAPNAKIPSELDLASFNQSVGMTLRSFVEALHITQYGYDRVWMPLTPEELAAAAEAFQNGTGEPIAMGIQSSRYSADGHAILPFRLERTNGPEDILHIYDPNYPLEVRFGYLEKNEAGKYIHWRYPANSRKTYGSRTGGILDCCPYDCFKAYWDNRGDGSYNKNLLVMTPGTALLDIAGTLLARVTESGVETFSDDISRNIVMSGRGNKTPILSVPVGTFRVVVEDPDLEKLSVQLVGVDLAINCSTVGQELELCVDDREKIALVKIDTPDSQYSIKIMSTLDETKEETVINGSTDQEALCLKQEYGQLYASGMTDRAVLYINRVNTPLDTISKWEEELEEEPEEAMLIANSVVVVVEDEDPQLPQD